MDSIAPSSSPPPVKKNKSKVKENGNKAKGKAKRKMIEENIVEEEEEATPSADERPLPDEDGEDELDVSEDEENSAAVQA